jgi:hypothetical protein
VCRACGERCRRWSNGVKEGQVGAGTITVRSLRNLTLNLRDDCLGLGKPAQVLR